MQRFEYIDIQYFVSRRVKLEIVKNLLKIALEQTPRTFAALKMLSRLTAVDLSEVLSVVGLEMTRCLLLTPRFSTAAFSTPVVFERSVEEPFRYPGFKDTILPIYIYKLGETPARFAY